MDTKTRDKEQEDSTSTYRLSLSTVKASKATENNCSIFRGRTQKLPKLSIIYSKFRVI